MALPSSPPLLPETDPPTSPPLLAEDPAELPVRISLAPISGPSRKRQFSDYDSLSSDPLFSEGTSDAEEEFSERQRRKRLVKGPWWRLRRASTQSLRRSMATRDRMRAADSGVWMGSDLSDDSIDSTLSSTQKLARVDIEEDSPLTTPPPSQTTPRLAPTAEDLAARIITRCLDTGLESVDLSDLRLTNLSNTTLRPLHQLIRHSHDDLTQPPSEDEFSSLTPCIRLFMYGNKLTSLPSELFKLTNITVLSLRNNNLHEIPPSIGRLSNLKELNIAQNNIRWLPWEMLDLMHCRGDHRRITVRPNPLISPMADFSGPSPLPRPAVTPAEYREHLSRWGETSGAFFQQMKTWYRQENVPWTIRHELELRLKLGRLRLNNYLNEASRSGVELQLCKEQLLYVASSAVTYFDVDGSPCRSRSAGAGISEEERFQAVIEPLADQPTSHADSAIPSLFELALRSAQANFFPTDLYEYSSGLPATVAAGIKQALKGIEHGNEACAVCGQQFIIARAEWMEYWFNGFPAKECLEPETVMPFLRRVCSWRCAKPSDLGAFRL